MLVSMIHTKGQNKGAAKKTSRNVSRRVLRPACIAGVLTS